MFCPFCSPIRESTFIMPRGRGDEDVKGGGGTEIFSGIKGGALKVLDILKGGGYKLFKVPTPTIINRIDGLETLIRIAI